MDKITHVLASAALLALVLVQPAMAENLAKKGSFAGVFSWYISSGQTIEVAKDHLIWGGIASGPFRNDSGSGFLHGAAGVCTFAGEFRKEAVTHNSGDCVATDPDGDKVTMGWKCTSCPQAGDIWWTNGTGKYAGIKGKGTFTQTDAGPPGGNSGWSTWKGQWELP